jgi:hypothetical protein
VKTHRQIKLRARARLARWIRDGRPDRLQKGLSAKVLAYIALHPGEEGVSIDALRIIAARRKELADKVQAVRISGS